MPNWKNWKGSYINPKTICDLLSDFEKALSEGDDAARGDTGVDKMYELLELAIGHINDFKPIDFSISINKLGHISERNYRLGTWLKNHQEFKRAWLAAAVHKLDGFIPQGLSNSIWGLAKLGYRDLEFENEWIRIAIKKLKGFNAQNLANSISTLAKLGCRDLEFENEWIRIAIKKLKDFNAQNLANSIEALADLGHYDKYFIKKWINVAVNRLRGFNPQELASSIRALANFNHYDEYFINKWIFITTEVNHKATKLDEFNPQELAISIRALANLEHHDKGFINSWIVIAINKLDEFNPQGLANSLSALANLGHYDKDFVDKWIDSIPSNKLGDFNTQNLANSIWALAKLKHYNGDFIEAWIDIAINKLNKFKPQELANSLSALANLGYHKEDFVVEWISSITTEKLDEFNSQDLANSIWAIAKLKHYNGDFIEAWIAVATKKLKDFNHQELANGIWALAKLKHRHEDFINAWIGIAAEKLYKFNAQDLANSVWALAKLNHYDEYFINEWIERATRELEEFSLQGLSNIIWALAKLEHSDQSFEKAWIASTTKQLKFNLPEEQFNPQNLANSIWALAKLEHQDEGFANAWIAIVTKKFEKLEKCKSQDLDDMKKFSPQDLANSIWALATLNLNLRNKSFEKGWIAIAIKKLKEFNLQNLANSVWALAKLRIDDRRLVASLFSQLKGRVEYFNAYEGNIDSIYDLENARHKWHDAQKLSSEAEQQLGVEERSHSVSASSAMETADNKRLRANDEPTETSLQKRQKYSYRGTVFSPSNRRGDDYERKDDQALGKYRRPVYSRTSAGEAGEISLVTAYSEQSQEKQNAGFRRKKDKQPPSVMFEASSNANGPGGRLDPVVMRLDKIKYENHLLNEAGAIELLNHATRYDGSVMNLLLELGTDREATDSLLEAVEESGARAVLDILSRKNEEAAPSGTQLTLVTVPAGPMPERTAPHSSNFFVNLINELTLRYKIMLYGSELRRFDEIITAYNIEIPKEYTKLDLLRNDRLFSKNVMLKVHPDKNLFGPEACHEDTIFVRELRRKLAQKLDIRRSLEDNVLTIQSVLYKANLGFKAVDACIDLARVVYEPTLPNIRKAALDYTYLYAIYSGFNHHSAFIGGADTLYQLSLGNYQEAFSTASSTMGYMLLPYMLALAPIPHAGFIYALWMTGYSAYYSFANAYAFYIEQSSEEAAFRSIAAYKELTGLIFNSPLQSLYDFAETAKGYEMQLTKAVLLKEHGEFGQKLYDYLYAPSLKEKYDLLSQISKNLISEEAAEALKAKHIVITDGHKSYDLCREIKATAIVDSEQYYCFNIEEQVLDHVMISGSGNLELIEHL